MQDKSIDGALLALRKQIIRSKGDGLAHVEALLTLRDVPMPRVLPVKTPDAARRGQMRALVYEALRGGPKPLQDIVAHVAAARPELVPHAAYKRTTQALAKMRTCERGGVLAEKRGGRCVWGLPDAQRGAGCVEPDAAVCVETGATAA